MGISSLWQYLQRFQVPVANCYDPLSTKISIKDYESNSSTFRLFFIFCWVLNHQPLLIHFIYLSQEYESKMVGYSK